MKRSFCLVVNIMFLIFHVGTNNICAQEKISTPGGTIDIMVHRAGSNNYSFLHDSAIVEHKNFLYAAWYNYPDGKMEGISLIPGRRSADKGLTLSDTEVIASEKEQKGIMHVPVTFLSWQGVLYAFVAIMEGGPDLVARCEVFILKKYL